MYSDLFSPSSLVDLQAVLPQIPFAIWETLYVTLLSTLLATVCLLYTSPSPRDTR